MNEQRTTVGDVRGESLGEYWPLDLVGIQEGWVIVNLTKDVDQQIKEARDTGSIYPYGHAGEAEDAIIKLREDLLDEEEG